MTVFSAILAFLQALPELIKIYKSLRDLFGDNWDKFLADLDKTTELVQKSKEQGVTIEQKREMRREALRLGVGMFGRISN